MSTLLEEIQPASAGETPHLDSPLNKLVTAYLGVLANERGSSPHTLRAYERELEARKADFAASYQRAGGVPNPFFMKRDASFGHPQFPIYLVTRLYTEALSTIVVMRKSGSEGEALIKVKAERGSNGHNIPGFAPAQDD